VRRLKADQPERMKAAKMNVNKGESSDGSDKSDRLSDRSVRTGGFNQESQRRLRPSGGYRQLRSYQVATVIYDATVSFCDRFVDKAFPHK